MQFTSRDIPPNCWGVLNFLFLRLSSCLVYYAILFCLFRLPSIPPSDFSSRLRLSPLLRFILSLFSLFLLNKNTYSKKRVGISCWWILNILSLFCNVPNDLWRKYSGDNETSQKLKPLDDITNLAYAQNTFDLSLAFFGAFLPIPTIKQHNWMFN